MSDSFLHLISRGSSPPDRYRYTFPEDGHRVVGFHYDGWLTEIKNHYQRNDYPMPENWKEIAEDQLCRLLPPGFCEYDTGELPEYYLNTRISIDDALNGTKVLMKWTISGFPLVDKEVAESRGATCASCWANMNVPGCGACVNFAGIVGDVVGQAELKSDAQLFGKVCIFCKCASRANVWVPVEVSRVGVDEKTLKAFPNYCWKKKEIMQLLANESQDPKSPS